MRRRRRHPGVVITVHHHHHHHDDEARDGRISAAQDNPFAEILSWAPGDELVVEVLAKEQEEDDDEKEEEDDEKEDDEKEVVLTTSTLLLREEKDSSSPRRGHRPTDGWRRTVQQVESLPSAQQQVWILHLGTTTTTTTTTTNATRDDEIMNNNNSNNNNDPGHDQEGGGEEDLTTKSTTTADSRPPEDHGTLLHDHLLRQWSSAVQEGADRVVVRCWKGARRWWNLNHTLESAPSGSTSVPGDCLELAQWEVYGYRAARQALHDHPHHADDEDEEEEGPSPPPGRLRIPRVLYFSHDDCHHQQSADVCRPPNPWALLEYVGPHSTLFSPTQYGPTTEKSLDDDTYWTESMIPVRHEFGFDEPHPRWGRVPVDQCLAYARQVLYEVVLPLHRYYYYNDFQRAGDSEPGQRRERPVPGTPALPGGLGSDQGVTFQHMVDLYHLKYDRYLRPFLYPHQSDATIEQEEAGHRGPHDDHPPLFQPELPWRRAILRLESALARLDQEGPRAVPALPFSLCHMDLQPQNLLFGAIRPDPHHHPEELAARVVLSVLDWEEAAWADPRFELLLLGRKVCADWSQAQALWQLYQQEMPHVQLGPLDPWLRLETVHSLTSLLLQATAGGGRSPWESQPELWGKIDREFQRLVLSGWTECRLDDET